MFSYILFSVPRFPYEGEQDGDEDEIAQEAGDVEAGADNAVEPKIEGVLGRMTKASRDRQNARPIRW